MSVEGIIGDLPVSFTTIPKRRTCIVALGIVAVLVSAWLWFYFTYLIDRVENMSPGVAWVLYIFLLFMAIFLFVVFCWPFARWTIDRHGVSYEPLVGQKRSIAWSEVERVIWYRSYAAIRHGQLTIPLPLAKLKLIAGNTVQECVSNILSDRFDLTPLPLTLPPDKSFKTIASWARFIGLLLPFAVLFWLCWRDPLNGAVYMVVMFAVAMLLLFGAVPIMAIRRAKKHGPLRWREPK